MNKPTSVGLFYFQRSSMRLSNYWLNRRREDILGLVVMYARWQRKDVRSLTPAEIRYVLDSLA